MSIHSQQTQRLARNFSWLSLQEALIRVFGLVIAIYLARTLGPSSYGALGLAMAVVGVFGALVQAGTGSRATRLTALDSQSVPETYGQITSLRLVLALVAIAGLTALAPFLARVFSFSATLLILCSFLLLRNALTVVWAFRGLDRMHVNTMAGVVEIALTLLGLVLLVHGRGDDVLFVPVVEVAAALLMVWWLRQRLGQNYPGLAIDFQPRNWVRYWPEIARESVPLGLASLLGSLGMHAAILLLGLFATSKAAANFLVAQKIVLALAVLIFVVHRSVFPSISRMLSGDRPATLALLASLLRYLLVFISPIVLLVALFAKELLVLLFGTSYQEAEPVLVFLLASLPILALGNSLNLLLKAVPKPGGVLASRIVTIIVLVVAAVWLIPRFGSVGAAVAVVAANLAGMLFQLYLVRRVFGSLPWNVRCFSPLAAAAGAAATFALLNAWALPSSLPMAIIAYVSLVLLMKAITLDELRSIPPLLLAIGRKPFNSST